MALSREADRVGRFHSTPILPPAETKPEIEKLAPLPVLCIHGEDEKESVCPDLAPSSATDLKLEGGHHLGGSFDTVAAAITKIVAK